jgi:hypothetical protein
MLLAAGGGPATGPPAGCEVGSFGTRESRAMKRLGMRAQLEETRNARAA